jgi:hypothetical protein
MGTEMNDMLIAKITKEEALELVFSKLQEDYVSGSSRTHWFVEIDDVYTIIDKIYDTEVKDSFNYNTNCTINLDKRK